MAHNIYDGKMFVVGKAWHDEGVRVDKELNSADAIRLAKLDYKIVKTPLYANVDGKNIPADVYGTLNTENNKILGTVTDRYKIVQNVHAFDFFDDIVRSGEAFYHSAGALGNGERIWILAKLPKDLIVFGDDVVEKYLLLTNSHDGKKSLLMYFTPIRVVCQNTLMASMSGVRTNEISIRHTGNIKGKVEEARRALGLALTFYDEFEVTVKALADYKFTDQKSVDNYFDDVLGIDGEKELSTQITNTKSRLQHLFEHGEGNQLSGIKNSLWAGYNAVTQYADYDKTFRGDNRTESILFGSSANMKRKAYEKAVELVKV